MASHSIATGPDGQRPRSYRTRDHLVYEATNGANYRIAVARLRTHSDLLRVIQWLVKQEGVELRSLETFIVVACNAAGLPQPGEDKSR